MTMRTTKAIIAMLEDVVAYANRKQMELVEQEVPNLTFPCRLEDLVVLSAALGQCIQGVDVESQIGSNYTWEDASAIQPSEEFVEDFNAFCEKYWDEDKTRWQVIVEDRMA